MTDRIDLRGVSALGRHGVLDFERTRGQLFTVDLTLELDLEPAGSSDDLADTVNYAEIAHEVVDHISGEPFDLIEALAARIAASVLAHDPVEAVEVTVHKPQAPVGVPFTDVAVRIRRERDRGFVVALGGNLGDVARTLESAVRELGAVEGVQVTSVSPLFETDPLVAPGTDPADVPAYLNAVAIGRTRLAPATLLAHLQRIEDAHHRAREVRWGSRTLDLDLIQYGTPGTDEVRRDGDRLTLPHPRAHERAFVLVPWAAADSAAVISAAHGVQDVAHLAASLGAEGDTVRPGPGWSPLGGPA